MVSEGGLPYVLGSCGAHLHGEILGGLVSQPLAALDTRELEMALASDEADLAADIPLVFQRGVEKAERSSTGQLSMHAHRVKKTSPVK